MLAARNHYMATETRRLPDSTSGFPTMRNDLHGDWIVATHARAGAEVLTIHPVREFWTFQAIETAIFVALAITLLSATIYWIRRQSS
jgi:hypothetical protein